MIKYIRDAVVFQEIPDEITLTLEITNCPHKCKDCHSPELREDIGVLLDDFKITELIEQHPGITCICFMGGDADHESLAKLADFVKAQGLLAAVYSGDDVYDDELAKHLDYYKVGSYQKTFGPLNKKTTNQRLYKLPEKIDITYKFWSEI